MNLDKLINYSFGSALLFGSYGLYRSMVSSEKKQLTCGTSCNNDRCSKVNLKLSLNLSGLAGGLMILREYYR